MEIFSVLAANRYETDTANWPADPTMVCADEEQCQLCNEGGCNCISSVLPNRIPHIAGIDGKGQGVRAIGFEREVVYKKVQVLGELLGEIVPLDTHHDG
jgi:hypothetical protein